MWCCAISRQRLKETDRFLFLYLGILTCGRQLQCRVEDQAALWRGPCEGVLRPSASNYFPVSQVNSEHQMPVIWVNHLGSEFSRCSWTIDSSWHSRTQRQPSNRHSTQIAYSWKTQMLIILSYHIHLPFLPPHTLKIKTQVNQSIKIL